MVSSGRITTGTRHNVYVCCNERPRGNLKKCSNASSSWRNAKRIIKRLAALSCYSKEPIISPYLLELLTHISFHVWVVLICSYACIWRETRSKNAQNQVAQNSSIRELDLFKKVTPNFENQIRQFCLRHNCRVVPYCASNNIFCFEDWTVVYVDRHRATR